MTRPEAYDEAYYLRMRGRDVAQRPGEGALYARFVELARGIDLSRARVLDAGSGRGELMIALRRAGAREVFGVDFSPAAVRLARSALREAFPGDPPELESRVREGSLADAALFSPESFDLIYLTDVVEHLPPEVLASTLSNVARWLRPDGRALIHTFPTLGPHRAYRAWLKATRSRKKLEDLETAHCNVQTRASLKAAVEGAGLECARLWLENDLAETSSAYQALPPGLPKRVAKLVLSDLPKLGLARWMAEHLEVVEYLAPSIYCEARVRGRASRAPS